MEPFWCVFIAAFTVSVLSVIFCIVRGWGTSRKKLVFFASALGATAMICFGGQAVLNVFGMGWRCTPFNTMLVIGTVLFIIILGFTMKELSILRNPDSVIVRCVFISIILTIFMTMMLMTFYFLLLSWHDGLTEYDGQTIVYANDQHGGSCAWRYYTHINALVHGEEILQEGGWIGHPPR